MKLANMFNRLSQAIKKLDKTKWIGWEVIEIPVWDKDKSNWDPSRLKGIRLSIWLAENTPSEINHKRRNETADMVNMKKFIDAHPVVGKSREWMKERVSIARKEYVHQGIEIVEDDVL